MKFVFLHRELELGGAQRLVIDAALAFKRLGHSVKILTSHHDPSYTYAETLTNDFDVAIKGDFLPRFSFFGYYLRMIWLALWLCFFSNWDYDAIFIDQFSYPIPLLKRFGRKGTPIFFYCHFPDKFICQADFVERTFFRWFWDRFEEWATAKADVIMANSQFTINTFYKAYPSLQQRKIYLLYPCINENLVQEVSDIETIPEHILPARRVKSFFLCLNRYDFKKDIGLAVKAFNLLKTKIPKDEFNQLQLVIAGAVNKRITEGYDCYLYLIALADQLQLNDHVTFITTPTPKLKWSLLKNCLALLYTPTNEHFGIVPLEAMFFERPVVAVRSGGPMETVLHERTGFLTTPGDVEAFSNYMLRIFKDPHLAHELGRSGHERVVEKFGFSNFTLELSKIIKVTIKL